MNPDAATVLDEAVLVLAKLVHEETDAIRWSRQDPSSILPWPPLDGPNSFDACDTSVEPEQSREFCIAQSDHC